MSVKLKYPEFEIKFDAEVTLGLYLFNKDPYLLGRIDRKDTKKVAETIELKDSLVLIDVDENDNVVNIEIMGECDEKDIKEE